MRLPGTDAEKDDFSALGDLGRAPYFRAKAFRFLDHVVGRHDDQDGRGIRGRRIEGCNRNGRRGIAAHGLENDCGRRDPGSVAFVLHKEAVGVVADEQGGGDVRPGQKPRQRRSEQAFAGLDETANELFWVEGAGQSRVPDPPERMTGMMVDMVRRLSDRDDVCGPCWNLIG